MQVKGTHLKISTLNLIYSVLILSDRLSKINETSPMMPASNSMCVMLLTASKELNCLRKTSDYVYQTSVTDAKQIAESRDFDTSFCSFPI